MNASVSDEKEHLPLMGTLVIQGLLFSWACESRTTLKVQHPQYGVRIVSLGRHYEPADPRQANSARHARHSNDH